MFSDKELTYLHDTDFLLTKEKVSVKLISILSDCESEIKTFLQSSDFSFENGTFLKAGKISKGNSYKDLPYFVLDYPRKFTTKSVFAFRSMIWWGNEASCTLHLGGSALSTFRLNLEKNLLGDPLSNLFVCVNDSPWEYHFDEDNYRGLEDLSPKEVKEIAKRSFVKVSKKLNLKELQNFPFFSKTCLKEFLGLLR